MDKNEALRMALEALQDYVDEYGPWSDDSGAQYVLRVGKEALAQPEQKAVPWATREDYYRELNRSVEHIRKEMEIKSVTMRCKDYDLALPIINTHFGRVLVGQVFAPSQREWVGLTDEEKESFWKADQMTHKEWDELFAAIEAKLREKNA